MLYQYSGEFTDHTVEAAHELVHAFRRAAGFWYSGFWEEGFAEAITMAVDPDDVGFPRYGYPLTVTAGHLLAWDEYVPLAEVRSRHRDVGRRCLLQAYLERASFFQYLVDREGLEAFIELSYGPRNPGDDDYLQVYGMSFDDLVADWESTLRSEYEAILDSDEIAQRYRAEPPIRGQPICSEADMN
jgi:hypothetical protein